MYNKKSIFSRKCGVPTHDQNKVGHIYDIKKSRVISKSKMLTMKKVGYLRPHSNSICRPCIDAFSSNNAANVASTSSSTSKKGEEKKTANSVKTFDNLDEDIKELSKKIKLYDFEAVESYSASAWLEQRPRELVSLVRSLCGLDDGNIDEKKQTIVAKIIELAYYCRHSRLVLPQSFRENLLSYKLTNCKKLISMRAGTSPGGSYTFICNWLSKQATEPISFPMGLVRSVFDNTRTYKITSDNPVPTSVMTSHLNIVLDPESIAQTDYLLNANNWMWKNKENDCSKRLIESMTNSGPDFRQSRDLFLKDCIQFSKNDHSSHNRDHIDEMGDCIKSSKLEKFCPSCGLQNDDNFRKCCSCGEKLVRVEFSKWETGTKNEYNPHKSFDYLETFAPPVLCHPGEPDFEPENPNSFQTISSVLGKIGERAGVGNCNGGEVRQWLFVECDGLPYVTMRELMDNVWTCEKCSESHYKREHFEEHFCFKVKEAVGRREFGWIVPVMGLHNFEMNSAQSFINTNWEVFCSTLGHSLGFQTPKAQGNLRKGSDHHKTWHFIQILYFAIGLELVTPFVRHCFSTNISASVNNYWIWQEKVVCPNYAYMQQMCLTYLHGLMMLRVGVRKCNYSVVKSAKTKLYHLFYARNHPKYQEITFRDALDDILMPDTLLQLKKKFVSVSRTGNVGKYQGGDALVEKLNKESKSGIHTDEQWRHFFRNLGHLNKVKQQMIPESHGGEDSMKHINAFQLNKVRVALRENNYLMDPMTKREHFSLDGKTSLDYDLVNFTFTANQSLIDCVTMKLAGKKGQTKKVLVTHSERVLMEQGQNRTKKEIEQKIYKIFKRMDRNLARSQDYFFQNNIKSKGKQAYLDFYFHLKNDLDLETNLSDSE